MPRGSRNDVDTSRSLGCSPGSGFKARLAAQGTLSPEYVENETDCFQKCLTTWVAQILNASAIE